MDRLPAFPSAPLDPTPKEKSKKSNAPLDNILECSKIGHVFNEDISNDGCKGGATVSVIPELFVPNLNDLSINDFIALLLYHADKVDAHPALQEGKPEYFSDGGKLRTFATRLGHCRDAAATGNREAKAEKMAVWEAGKLAVGMNMQHITMLSLYRKDPSILNNTGLEQKQKQQASKSSTNLLAETPVVTVKHVQGAGGPISGSIIVVVSRSKNTLPIELQMTYDPANESSWGGQGIHLKSRIEYHDLEPAKWVHFRARYHLDGKTSQWSPVASIIVL